MRFAVLLLLLSIAVRADQITIPYPLSNNTVANAQHVQENFSVLAQQGNDHDARITDLESLTSYDTVRQSLSIATRAEVQSSVSVGNNVAIGTGTMSDYGDSDNNTAVGNRALMGDLTFDNYPAPEGDWGGNNVAVGVDALRRNASGQRNIAVGQGSMFNNRAGARNVAIGYYALATSDLANDNTAVGDAALQNLSAGEKNVAVGRRAMFEGSGSNNVAVGVDAMKSNLTGSYNTFVGFGADATADVQNSTAIGFNAKVDQSDSIQLGDSSVASVKTAGKITMGAVTYTNEDGESGQVLTTDGNGSTSWTAGPGISLTDLRSLLQVEITEGSSPEGAISVMCPGEKKVLGGGCNLNGSSSTAFLYSSSPSGSGGWSCLYHDSAGWNPTSLIQAYAICL